MAYGLAGVLRSVPALAGQGRCLLPAETLARHGLSAEAVVAAPGAAGPVVAALAAAGCTGRPRRCGCACRGRRPPPACRWCWHGATCGACGWAGRCRRGAASATGWPSSVAGLLGRI